jgi:hypothetical protein
VPARHEIGVVGDHKKPTLRKDTRKTKTTKKDSNVFVKTTLAECDDWAPPVVPQWGNFFKKKREPQVHEYELMAPFKMIR